MEGLFLLVLLAAGVALLYRRLTSASPSRTQRKDAQIGYAFTAEEAIGAGRVIVEPPPVSGPPRASQAGPVHRPATATRRASCSPSASAPHGQADGGTRPNDAPGNRSRGIQLGRFNDLLPSQAATPDQPALARDPDYEGSEGVRDVFAALGDSAEAVLVYGGAGVGKSHLVRYLRSAPGGETTVVVAPTAIAALTSGGQTVHSFFQLAPQVLDARDLETFRGQPGRLWRGMTRLIVDEISMVRPDLFDSMHARLKHLRESTKAFGGVQVILVGDPLQLPPVAKHDDLNLLHAMGYKTPFLHSAMIWNHVDDLRAVELTRVFRQTEADFIAALNDLRRGRNLGVATAFLNERCFRPHRETATPVLLTPSRAAADRYNSDGLAALSGPETRYRGVVEGMPNVQDANLPVPETLRLKVGAEVMALSNDTARRWVNGSRGQVVDLMADAATVRFHATGQTHRVEPHTWAKVKQTWDAASTRILNERKGGYTQLPLIPGWALTIHKAQGMTLDDVRVDLGDGAFASGQLYVAVSRARSLDGLSLARPLAPGDVKPDTHLLAFMDWLDQQRGL